MLAEDSCQFGNSLSHAVFTSSVGPETAVFVAVLSIWPTIIEATKIGKGDTPALFPWAAPWQQK